MIDDDSEYNESEYAKLIQKKNKMVDELLSKIGQLSPKQVYEELVSKNLPADRIVTEIIPLIGEFINDECTTYLACIVDTYWGGYTESWDSEVGDKYHKENIKKLIALGFSVDVQMYKNKPETIRDILNYAGLCDLLP